MSDLQKTLEAYALELAHAIVHALRVASVDELMAITGEGGSSRAWRSLAGTKNLGRLPRRSVDEISAMLATIVTLLSQHPEGLRAEQIRTALECDARELPRPLAEGLKRGLLTKSGHKRATTYFAGKRARKK